MIEWGRATGDKRAPMESAQVVEAISLLAPRHALASAALCGATLYVGGEDGSLRLYASREDPLGGGRREGLAFEAGAPQTAAPPSKPAFEAGAVHAQFSRRREPVAGLCAVPEWRALFSQTGAFGALGRPLGGLAGTAHHTLTCRCTLHTPTRIFAANPQTAA